MQVRWLQHCGSCRCWPSTTTHTLQQQRACCSRSHQAQDQGLLLPLLAVLLLVAVGMLTQQLALALLLELL